MSEIPARLNGNWTLAIKTYVGDKKVIAREELFILKIAHSCKREVLSLTQKGNTCAIRLNVKLHQK